MKRVATTVRCVPRYGFENTEVRTIDLEGVEDFDEAQFREALERWFAQHGIADAVYSIEADNNGYFAVINDEVFAEHWGARLL
jgi:hypothetical protein